MPSQNLVWYKSGLHGNRHVQDKPKNWGRAHSSTETAAQTDKVFWDFYQLRTSFSLSHWEDWFEDKKLSLSVNHRPICKQKSAGEGFLTPGAAMAITLWRCQQLCCYSSLSIICLCLFPVLQPHNHNCLKKQKSYTITVLKSGRLF